MLKTSRLHHDPQRELISLWRPLPNDEITSRVQHAKDQTEQFEDASIKRSWRRNAIRPIKHHKGARRTAVWAPGTVAAGPMVAPAAAWEGGVSKCVAMTSNNYVIKSPSIVIERDGML